MLINFIICLIFFEYFYRLVYPNYINKLNTNINAIIEHNMRQYEPFIMNISFNAIYYFSVCQINFKKLSKLIIPYITTFVSLLNFDVSKEKNTMITFFKNGKLENHIEIEDNSDIINFIENIETFDLVILHDKKNNKTKNHYFREPHHLNESTIRFISMMLIYENNTYEIELSNNTHNYYIVGNIIDSRFLYYYLKYLLNHKLCDNINDFKYTLEILDDNVNIIVIDETHKILIHENSYELITPNKILDISNNLDTSEKLNILNNLEKNEDVKDIKDELIKETNNFERLSEEFIIT